MDKFEFSVLTHHNNLRLDKFLTANFAPVKSEINRSKVQKLINDNLVTKNSNIVNNSSLKVKEGEIYQVSLAPNKASTLIAKEIDFEIIFEDEDLLVINKPHNLTVHPGAGNQEHTLVNALLFSHQGQLSSICGSDRPGIVHRLDKDTSGLMLVAKNDLTHQILSKNLQERLIKRSYLAFIYGVLEPKKGRIEANIIRNRNNRLKMTTARVNGRFSATNYQTIKTYHNNFASLIKCNLETGRTHQIRVHLEHKKHSIIGDQLYNSCKKNLPKDSNMSLENQEFIKNFPRQALHSYQISFEHPTSKKEMFFEIDLSSDLKKLQQCLES